VIMCRLIDASDRVPAFLVFSLQELKINKLKRKTWYNFMPSLFCTKVN